MGEKFLISAQFIQLKIRQGTYFFSNANFGMCCFFLLQNIICSLRFILVANVNNHKNWAPSLVTFLKTRFNQMFVAFHSSF